MWGHMGDYGWGWGWGWGGMAMGAGMIFFWGILIAVIVLLVRFSLRGSNRAGQEREKTALDLLKERYARGEIGRDEFEQIKHDLEH